MPATRSSTGAKPSAKVATASVSNGKPTSNTKRSRTQDDEKTGSKDKKSAKKAPQTTQNKSSNGSSKARPTAMSVIDAAEEAEKEKRNTFVDGDDMIPLDAEDGSEEDVDSEAEDAEDDDAAILAELSEDFEEDGQDSSDEDDEDDLKTKSGTISTSGVVKLPSSRDDAVVKAKLEKVNKKRKESGQAGKPIVLFFGRIPKSMPEDALRAYLTQFGDIRRLRLARNRKTGAMKHYAFVEFDDEEVGKIVCETMHNYLLQGRLLQVFIIPKEKQHPNLWIGANRKFRKVPADRLFRISHDKVRTQEQKDKVEKKLLQRQDKRKERIKKQGIDYDFEGYTKA